jgi:hypothetical protein
MRILAVAVLTCASAASSHAEKIAWMRSYKEAKVKAGVEGKLIFLDFYTDW